VRGYWHRCIQLPYMAGMLAGICTPSPKIKNQCLLKQYAGYEDFLVRNAKAEKRKTVSFLVLNFRNAYEVIAISENWCQLYAVARLRGMVEVAIASVDAVVREVIENN
jgi:hypothetical protein